MYGTQVNKNNINISAFRIIPVRSAKACVKLFLALQNDIYSHRV